MRRRIIRGTDLHAAVVLEPPVTGMTIATRRVLSLIADYGIQTRILSVSRSDADSNAVWRIRKYVGLIGSTLRAASRARRHGGQVYIVSESRFGLPVTLLQVLILRSFGLDYFLHHHVFRYCRNWSVFMWLITALGGGCLHIVLCDEMLQAFKRVYGATNVVILDNSLAIAVACSSVLDLDPQDCDSTDDVLRVGILGNLTLSKGVDSLIAAVELLGTRGIDAKLELAGPLSDEVTDLISRSSASISVWGFVGDHEKEGFFDRLTVFALPSRYANEADPLVVLEAQQLGVPAVVTPRGCMVRYQDSEGAVVVSEPVTDSGLADAIVQAAAIPRTVVRRSFEVRQAQAEAELKQVFDGPQWLC